MLSYHNKIRLGLKLLQSFQYHHNCLSLLFSETLILLNAFHGVNLTIVIIYFVCCCFFCGAQRLILSRLFLSYLVLSCQITSYRVLSCLLLSYLTLCPGNDNSDEEFGVENFLFLIHLPDPSPYIHIHV